MLEGLTVWETGTEPAVRFCGWLFAMNGAEVKRIDSGRSCESDVWSNGFLNAGKSVVGSVDAGSLELDLLNSAEVVIADPDYDWENFSGLATATGTVDAFGTGGPYANWQGNEIVYATLAGATGYTFTREGVPVYGHGDRYQYLAGMYLFQSLCATLLQTEHDGGAAPRVRVSNFESVVSLLPYLTTQFEYNGTVSTAEQSGPRFVSACQDGFVVAYAGFEWAPIAKTLQRQDLLDDVRFVGNSARFANLEPLSHLFDEWASSRTVEEACEAGELNNVAITEVRSPAAVLADDSLMSRGAWYGIQSGNYAGVVPAMPYTANGVRPHRVEDVRI